MAKGRYRISRKIADGGMAEIFSGTQHGVEGFERPVVLKRILPVLLAEPQFKNLMIDEAHVAMSLSHSNIVQVLDLGQAKGSYYLVLELVDGWDLNNILNRLKALPDFQLPPTLGLFIVGEVCRALAYAHGRRRGGKPMGIVHRDVSPHNVLISVEGEVKLTDFGIAKAMVRRENTLAGVIKGKLAFMSPEQASGSVIDARSDLFSLGTLLYLMFTGRKPFEAPTDLESILRVQKADFPPPERAKADLAPEVAALIKRAMQLAPSDRYQTADAMLEAIEEVQRQVFGPSGKTELKRWLSELESRDGVPSITRMPMPPGARPDDTLELGDNDIEFEPSAMAMAPGSTALGATLAADRSQPSTANEASAVPQEIGFAPTSQTVSERPPTPLPRPPEAAQPPPRRTFLYATGAIALLAGGVAWAVRLRLPGSAPAAPPPAPEPAQPPERAEEAPVSPSPPTQEEPVGVAEAPQAPPAPEAPPVPDAAATEDEDEEALLAQAETGVDDKVIGEDPNDAEPAPPPKPTRRKAPETPTAKPAPQPRVVSVKIVTRPPGAVVKLKKRVFGRAPMSLRFQSGQTYELHFVKQGYTPATKRVSVTSRKNQTVTVSLRKRAPQKKKNFLQRMFGL